MSHSRSQIHIHLVFSTKNREKLISRQFQPRLWAYMAAICKNNGMLTFAIGGTEDHVHLLFRLPPIMSPVRAVTLIKSNSSKWIRKKGIRFAWQQGYGAFSVSSSNVPAVIKYIDNQEAHHRKRTYEQEIKALLEKHGLKYDPEEVLG